MKKLFILGIFILSISAIYCQSNDYPSMFINFSSLIGNKTADSMGPFAIEEWNAYKNPYRESNPLDNFKISSQYMSHEADRFTGQSVLNIKGEFNRESPEIYLMPPFEIPHESPENKSFINQGLLLNISTFRQIVLSGANGGNSVILSLGFIDGDNNFSEIIYDMESTRWIDPEAPEITYTIWYDFVEKIPFSHSYKASETINIPVLKLLYIKISSMAIRNARNEESFLKAGMTPQQRDQRYGKIENGEIVFPEITTKLDISIHSIYLERYN
jgi:hypothetical protein